MKVYEAIFNEGETEGVYGISLVENPAMEDFWITLSEQPQEIHFSAVDDEKNLLLGAVLIPNKKVYRNIDGHEFYITFTEKTVEKLLHNFSKKGYQNNSSEEHSIKLSDVTFVENWIVNNPEMDKSASYGKKYENGTWVTMAHVSEDTYAKAKNGEIKGFSIDGLLGLQEVQLKTDIKMEKETSSIVDAIKEGFAAFLGKHNKDELKKEEVEVKEFDMDAFKAVLSEALKQFSDENDSKLESKLDAFKTELTAQIAEKETVIEAKDKEIETLKVELSKEAEVEAIKPKGEKEVVKLSNNRPETIQDRVMANLQKTVWNG